MRRSRDDDEPDWLRSAAAQLGGAPEKENDPAQAPPPPAAAADAPGKVRELEQETRRQEKIVGKLMRELKDEKLTGAVRAVDGLERLRAELGGELRAATAGVGELRAALGAQLEAARRQLGARGADGGLAHRLADEQRARARAEAQLADAEAALAAARPEAAASEAAEAAALRRRLAAEEAKAARLHKIIERLTHEVKAAAVAPPSFKAAVAAIDAVGERVSARLDATTTALDAVRAAVADGVAAAARAAAAADPEENVELNDARVLHRTIAWLVNGLGKCDDASDPAQPCRCRCG